jgi:hypothetical protein
MWIGPLRQKEKANQVAKTACYMGATYTASRSDEWAKEREREKGTQGHARLSFSAFKARIPVPNPPREAAS